MNTVSHRNRDRLILIGLITLFLIVPVSVYLIQQNYWNNDIPERSRVFNLTGHVDYGWVTEPIKAMDVVSFKGKDAVINHPILEVNKGDRVVLKISSSDVIHGFSLIDFNVVVDKGVYPGNVTVVSFVADKAGSFDFSCNAICGDRHEKMKGTLIVKDSPEINTADRG